MRWGYGRSGMTAKVFRASPLSGVVVLVQVPERAGAQTEPAAGIGSNARPTVAHGEPMWGEA